MVWVNKMSDQVWTIMMTNRWILVEQMFQSLLKTTMLAGPIIAIPAVAILSSQDKSLSMLRVLTTQKWLECSFSHFLLKSILLLKHLFHF